jgi:hypothetical protein
MKTRTSFLLRFLLPPLYASAGFMLFSTTALFREPLARLGYAGILVLYAYAFAGVPALLFAILLSRFARRRPSRGGRLVRATLFGLASGAVIGAMFGFDSLAIFLPMGALTGLAVETTVIAIESRTPAHFA